MEKMNIEYEKTKSNITNIDKISNDLNIQPKILVEYFKKKLGVSAIYKKGIMTIKGKMERGRISDVLTEFIEDIILCTVCKLPEVVIEVEKKQLIGKCNSCSETISYDKKLNNKILKSVIRILTANKS